MTAQPGQRDVQLTENERCAKSRRGRRLIAEHHGEPALRDRMAFAIAFESCGLCSLDTSVEQTGLCFRMLSRSGISDCQLAQRALLPKRSIALRRLRQPFVVLKAFKLRARASAAASRHQASDRAENSGYCQTSSGMETDRHCVPRHVARRRSGAEAPARACRAVRG